MGRDVTLTHWIIYWLISWIAICRADSLNPFDDSWEMLYVLLFAGLLLPARIVARIL